MPRLPGRLAAWLVAILTLSIAIGGCVSGISGHAETDAADQPMELGTIGASAAGRTVHVQVDVSEGSVRIDFVGSDARVEWSAIAVIDSPIREDVPMPANAGPWRVTFTALDGGAVAEYRIDTR